MIKTILGIIILLTPFLLISRFKDTKKGFFYILTFLITFHLLTAITTQLFGIFDYKTILGINLALCFITILNTNYYNLKKILKKTRIDFVLIFVLIIVFLEFYSVHFNYSGKLVTIDGTKNVKNFKYTYPYFSDEWSAISLINYSIENKKLPLVNPLWKNTYFPNLEFSFHSFLAEFFLILNLKPLEYYTSFSIFFSMFICFLVYSILKLNTINSFAAAIPPLTIPLITNSGNFPAFWYLIPITLGIFSLLLVLIFVSLKQEKMVLLSSFLTLIFYPPLFVFLTFLILSCFSNKSFPKLNKNLIFYFLLCFFAAMFLIFSLKPLSSDLINLFRFINSKIFYQNFTLDMIPDYSPWKILPVFSLIFFIISLPKLKNKKHFLIPLIIGIIYWILYSKVLWRFIIDYDRVVLTSSVFIILASGFGVQTSLDFLKKHLTKKTLLILQTIIFSLFFIYAFFYTSSTKWETIKFYTDKKTNERTIDPNPPANLYLQKEDLELFRNITRKVFLSPSWKGLTIGVTTKNYPLDSKPSVITNTILEYDYFLKLDCENKKQLASFYEISYVYSKSFDCDSFELIGKSKELFLYKFKT